MPNKWTFKIKPIRELLQRYNVGLGWIDPFAGMYSPAEYTNDLNPECNARWHFDALYFSKMWNNGDYEFEGCVFDPPYTLTQVSRSYHMMNKDYAPRNKIDPTGGFPDVKNIIGNYIKKDGFVISFGYNSVGFGKNRGFEIIEILLVSHGGNRNDTIVTVEKKVQKPLLEG